MKTMISELHKLATMAMVAVGSALFAETPKMSSIFTVPHELDMVLNVKAGHIQGACCSEQGIYLSYQLGVIKIGWDGKFIKTVEAPNHLGDIAYANGKIYGAFVLRDAKPGEMQGLVRVWDEDLNMLAEKKFPEPLDGIAVIGDTVYVGVDRWGHKKHPLCCVKRLALDLEQKDNVDVDLGYEIYFGVQTMSTDGEGLVFGNYGGTSLVSADLKKNEKVKFYCAEGFGLVPKAVTKSDAKIFFVVRPINGNWKGWRKDPVKNPPRVRIDFYELKDGKFIDITKNP